MAAFAIFFIAFVIVTLGLIIVTVNVAINEMITVMNTFISDGSVSKQFVTYWNFAIGTWIALPILGLVALTIWAIVRAIERRQEDGY